MSLFITFEGGEGCGKSTQARILLERLRKQKKWGVSLYQEPGTTIIGKQVREWLHHPNNPLEIDLGPKQLDLFSDENQENIPTTIRIRAGSPRAELLAFVIARSELVEEKILPDLNKDYIVVCDRYADSTVAYQGYGRKLDIKLVKITNDIATQCIKPQLTILLDIDPEIGLSRKFVNEAKNFEMELLEFHYRVRKGYIQMTQEEPDRWLVIDAEKSTEEIAGIIWQRVSKLLPR